MRKPCLFIAALLLALAAAPRASAQQKLAGRVFPQHFGSWTANCGGDEAVVAPFAGFAGVQKEAGLAGVDFCDYVSGSNKIHVHLDQYRDPSSAYEVYTSLLTMDMHPSTVWGPSAINKDHLYMMIGNTILDVRGSENASAGDLTLLGKAVQAHVDRTPLPPIRTYLPQGLMDGSQRYALGPAGFQGAFSSLKRDEFASMANEVGFASGAEAMIAEYRRGNDSAGLLLLEYPTPQLAEQHLHHLEEVIPAAARQAGTTIERKASLLTVVLNPTSKEFGDNLRASVNYETAVTWHQPTHTITDPPWATILGKIFFATALFMVVATVLGIAFGGVRVITKRFFPGKVFDRPEQMEVLQLGLSGKRIDPRDLY